MNWNNVGGSGVQFLGFGETNVLALAPGRDEGTGSIGARTVLVHVGPVAG